jgi:hypothetical protein
MTAGPPPPRASRPSTDALARAAVILNGGLIVAFVALWINLALNGSFWRADFTAFYLGGRMVLDGDGGRLYDLPTQGEYQARLWPERGSAEQLLGFVYPPQDALLFTPFALLERMTAFYAWTAVNLVLLLLFVHFVRRAAEDETSAVRLAVVVTALAFPSVFMTFQLGQLSLVSVVALLGFCTALRAGRQTAAGAWLVLGTVKPQLMVIPAVILLAGRRWRALAVAGCLFALWATACTIVLGPHCWTDFLATIGHCSRQFGTYGIHPLRMYNFKGLLTAILGSDHADRINLLTTALSIAALLFAVCLWLRPWPADRRTFSLRLALTLLLGLLTNPHLNPADALAYVVPAVLLVGCLPQARPRFRLGVLAAAAPLLFLIDNFATASWPGDIRPFFLGLVAWAAWLLCFKFRQLTQRKSLPTARPVGTSA